MSKATRPKEARRRIGRSRAAPFVFVLLAVSPAVAQEQSSPNDVTVPIPWPRETPPTVDQPPSVDQPEDEQPDVTPLPAGPGRQQLQLPSIKAQAKTAAPEPGFQISLGADLSEIYTNNAFATNTNEKPDLDNRLSLDLDVHEHSDRFSADLSNSIAGDLYTLHPSLDGLADYLNGLAKGTLIDETLLVEARAFGTPLSLSTLGPLSSEQRAIPGGVAGGYSNAYGFSVEPDLKTHFADVAQSELTLTQGSVFITQPIGAVAATSPLEALEAAPGNTSSTVLAERLSSGPLFTSATWTMEAEDSETYGSYRYSDRIGTAEIDYPLTRNFGILATAGYDAFAVPSGTSMNLDGPIAKLGFHLTADRSFELTFHAGLQYHSASYTGDLSYAVSPRLSLSASLSDDVTTPADRLLSDLQTLGAGAATAGAVTGGASAGATQLGSFSPLPLDQLLINTALSRYRTLDLTAAYKTERTAFQVAAFGTRENQLTNQLFGISGNSTSLGGRFTATHDLTRNATLSMDATYTWQKELGIFNRVVQADLGWRYMFSPVTSLDARGSYIGRSTSGNDLAFLPEANALGVGNLNEVEISLTLHRKF